MSFSSWQVTGGHPLLQEGRLFQCPENDVSDLQSTLASEAWSETYLSYTESASVWVIQKDSEKYYLLQTCPFCILSVQKPKLRGVFCFVSWCPGFRFAFKPQHLEFSKCGYKELNHIQRHSFFLKQSVTHTLSHSSNFSSSAKPILGSHMFSWLNIEPISTSSQ